jgi:hypothetical protein
MNRTSDNPAPETSFERPSLRIAHLLLWTACTAVFLGVVTAGFPSSEWTPWSSLLAMSSISAGGGLAGLLVLFRPFFRGGRFAPGEVLLSVAGACSLMMIVEGFYRVAGSPGDYPWPEHSFIYMIRSLLLLSLGGIAWLGLLFAAARRSFPLRWRLLYASLFAAPWAPRGLEWVVQSLQPLLVPAVSSIIYVGLLSTVAWLDRRKPIRYPWTHWAGLLIFGWAFLASSISMFVAVVNQV